MILLTVLYCSLLVFAAPATGHLRRTTASYGSLIVRFSRDVCAGTFLYPRRRATHHPLALDSSRLKQQLRVDVLLWEDKASDCRCFRATVGWRVVRRSALQAHHRRWRGMKHHHYRERTQTRETRRSPGHSQKLGMWCATRANGRATSPSERLEHSSPTAHVLCGILLRLASGDCARDRQESVFGIFVC